MVPTYQRKRKLSLGMFINWLPKHRQHKRLMPRLIHQLTSNTDKGHQKIKKLSSKIKQNNLWLFLVSVGPWQYYIIQLLRQRKKQFTKLSNSNDQFLKQRKLDFQDSFKKTKSALGQIKSKGGSKILQIWEKRLQLQQLVTTW